MRVEVRLFATLASYRPEMAAGEAIELAVRDRTTIADLLEHLTIPSSKVHLVMVDGRIAHDRRAILSDGARVGLFPPVGGG